VTSTEDNKFPNRLSDIDVEGYEHAVIAGGQSTLASPSLQVVIMETNGSGLRYGWDDAELVDTMRGHGGGGCGGGGAEGFAAGSCGLDLRKVGRF
jgi:hypothetical protein